MAFDIGVNIIVNPGNAISNITSINSALDRLKTMASQSSQSGIGNMLSQISQNAVNTSTSIDRITASVEKLTRISATPLGNLPTQLNEITKVAGNAVTNINSVAGAFERLRAQGGAFAGFNLGNLPATMGTLVTNVDRATTSFERFKAVSSTPLGNFAGQVRTAALSFNELGIAAGRSQASFSATTQSMGQTGNALANLNSQLSSSASGLNNLGNAASSSSTGLGRLREIFSGNRGLVFGLSALFGTITGIVFEFQLMSDASKQVADSQAQVNALVASGQKGTAQYQQALQALGKDQRFLEFSTRNMALAFTNLIPDVLLITNGLIQLTDKFKTTGTAAQALGTGMSGAQTAMTTTTTATTTLNTASTALTTSQTALATETLVVRDAYAGVAPIMAATRTEEAALTLTSDGLVASQAAVATEAVVSRDAVGSIGPVMATVRAEEALLAGSNDALGASFLAMGAKAEAGAARVGGIKGLFSKIGGGIGGFLSGTGGAVLGPLALAGAFAGAVDIIIQGAKETDQKILESGKIMDAANRTMNTGLDGVINKTKAGTATMSEAWDAFGESVRRNAGIITNAQASIPPPTLLGEKNLLAGTANQAKTSGPVSDLLKAFGLSGQQDTSEVDKLYGVGGNIRNQPSNRNYPIIPGSQQGAYGGPAPPPTVTLQQTLADINKQYAMQAAQVNKTGVFDAGKDIGKIPVTRQIGAEDIKAAEEAKAKIEGLKSRFLQPDYKPTIKDVQDLSAGYDELGKALNGASSAGEIAKQKEEEKQKAYQASQDQMNTYNKMLDAQPKLLQDVGVATKQLSDDEIERQSTIRDSAAVFIGHANAMKVSLGVAEQVGVIGKKITDGLIEQRDSIEAENIVWENMGTVIEGTTQTIGGWIGAQQQAIFSSINVTASLTNQAQHQFLVNEGMIAGKLAAQQFLESSIVGAAQNKQYVESLQGIITAMNIQVPAGMKLTAQQAEAVINAFNETGSAAGVFAAIINDRIQPAVQRLGDVLQAKNWKEFKDAFKGLEFGDAPDKLVNKFKDFDNMLRKINEDGREMQTVFDQMDIMQSLGKLDVKTFSQGLDAMAKQVEHIGKLQDIDVSNIVGFLNDVKNMKDPNALVKFHDLLSLISADAQNGYTSQELEDINFQIDKLKVDGIIKVKDALDAVTSSARAALDPMTAITNKNLNIGPAGNLRLGEQVSSEFEKIVTPQPEDKFSSAVDKFASAVSTFAAGKTTTPPTVSAGASVGASAGAKGGVATDAFKGGGALSPMVTEAANTSKQVQTIYSSMFVAIVGIVSGMQKAITGVFGGITSTVVKETSTLLKTVIAEFSSMAKGVVTLMSSMAVNSNKIIGQMAVNIFTNMGTMITNSITIVSAFAKGVLVLFAAMADNSLEIVVAFSTNVSTAFATMSKGVQTEVGNLYTAVTDIFSTMKENVLASIGVMNAQGVADVATMSKGIQTEVSNLYTFVTDVINKMNEDVVSAIEEMNKNGTKAVNSFASAMDSALTKVAKAAGTAWQAVTDLGDAVDDLDGKSATVTVTTEFKTKGSPPSSGGGKQTIVAHGLLTDVIAASKPRSFAEGGIQTAFGPQLALFGDNPGGIETHAFIPHDNPFPILRKLAKMFNKNSRAGEVVDKALGRAEEMWIDLHLQIDNIMDGEKVSRQIVRKTFKKMRTRP